MTAVGTVIRIIWLCLKQWLRCGHSGSHYWTEPQTMLAVYTQWTVLLDCTSDNDCVVGTVIHIIGLYLKQCLQCINNELYYWTVPQTMLAAYKQWTVLLDCIVGTIIHTIGLYLKQWMRCGNNNSQYWTVPQTMLAVYKQWTVHYFWTAPQAVTAL